MFLVEGSTAGEFVETGFELDVAFEEFVFGTHADCLAEGFTCDGEVVVPDFEVGFQEPDFGEGELFVWD